MKSAGGAVCSVTDGLSEYGKQIVLQRQRLPSDPDGQSLRTCGSPTVRRGGEWDARSAEQAAGSRRLSRMSARAGFTEHDRRERRHGRQEQNTGSMPLCLQKMHRSTRPRRLLP